MKKQTYDEVTLENIHVNSDINGHKLMLFFSNKIIYELDFDVSEKQVNCAKKFSGLSEIIR